MFRDGQLKRLVWRPKVWVLGLLLVLLAFYIVETFVAAMWDPQVDLSIYYLAVSRLSSGLDPYAWQLFLDAAQREIHGPMPLRDYIYIIPDRGLLYSPLFAVLFMPISKLEYWQVKILWWVFNNVLLAGVIILTIKALGSKVLSMEGGMVALMYLGNPALHHTVALGQINLLQLFLLLLHHISLKAGRKVLSGWFMGLALVLLRPTVAALFPLYLFWKREYKVFLWSALAGGLLFLAPLPWVGLEVYGSYLSKVGGGDVTGVFAAKHNQSLAGFFYSLAFPDKLMSSNNGPLGQGPLYAPIPQFSFYLMAGIVLAITAFYTWPGKALSGIFKEHVPSLSRDWPRAEWEFSLVLLATLLVPHLTWNHSYVMVGFPFAAVTVFLIRQQERRWQVWVTLGFIYYAMVGKAGSGMILEPEHPIFSFVTLLGAFALWCIIIFLLAGVQEPYHGSTLGGPGDTVGAYSHTPLRYASISCAVAFGVLLLLSIALFLYGTKGQKAGHDFFFQAKSRPFLSDNTLDKGILIVAQDGRAYNVEEGTGNVIWQRSFQPRPLCAPPAAAGDMVYVASCWGDIYAVSSEKGIVWKGEGLGMISAQPLVSGDSLYVGSLKKELVALKRDTGQVRWRYQTGGYVSATPLLVDGKLIFGSGDGNLLALDTGTGRVIWEVSLGAPLDGGAVALEGKVYVPSRDGNLYELRVEDGWVLRRIEIGSPIIARPALSPGGTLYLGAVDGGLYAVDLAEGKVKWRATTGGAIMVSPVVAQGAVYVGSLDRRLYAFDVENGRLLWSKETDSWVTTSPVLLGGTVYMASDDNKVYALRPDLIK